MAVLIDSLRSHTNSVYESLSIRRFIIRYDLTGHASLRNAIDNTAIPKGPDAEKPKIRPALEPDIGGRKVEVGDLKPGDILLITISPPPNLGVSPPPNIIARAFINENGQSLIGSDGSRIQRFPVASLLEQTGTASVFRNYPSDVDINEGIGAMRDVQETRGAGIVEQAIGKIGSADTGWIGIPEAIFRLDTPSWGNTDPDANLVNKRVSGWLGHINLGVPRPTLYYTFYCPRAILGILSDASVRLTVDDFTNTGTSSIRINRPLGYVGHLKGPP